VTTSDKTNCSSAAVVGVNENVEHSSQHAADSGSSSLASTSKATLKRAMDGDKAPVKIVVVDGTLIGPSTVLMKIVQMIL